MRAERCAAALAVIAALGGAGAARADSSYLGGFRPVAAEESARSLWVNPAAIGIRGVPRAAVDLVWFEQDRLRPGDARRLSIAVSMLDAAYGLQLGLADETGVPDWTLTWGKRLPVGGALSLGFDVEWRGGEDSAFDGALGALAARREWSLGAAVTNLFEPETQGVPAVRTWQLGVAWRPPSMEGRFTYDAVLPAGADSRHWFGVAFDRTRRIRLAGALSTAGDWNATVDFVLGSHLLGAGARDPEGGSRREFAAWEWTGAQRRQQHGPRTGNPGNRR
ncbi:MAG: hypothetical protein VKI81_09655 [Synechococcaceae cyanobacterium]|nr:hypothetical protein [Synechococcaceae cyanobacterium]